MRVFINALSARLGGGQTYLLNLLRQSPSIEGLEIFLLVQPSFHLVDLPPNVVRLEQASLENPYVRAIWEEVRLPSILRQLDIDLFFSPGGLLPKFLPSDILTAVTFQNMLPFDHEQRQKYPYGYRRLRDWLLERGLSASMRKADLVIFISEFAREFIHGKLGKLRGRSIVVPHGIHPSFKFDSSKELDKPEWLPEGEYFLYVSFIDHYKAQLQVVRGFYLYLQQGGAGRLLLVGAEYPPYGDLVRREIALLGLSKDVLIIGNVPHGELPAAYQNARVNIFASFTENCPNILLEMMASGRPALVSNLKPMTEFGGDVVEYFDPGSPDEFALKLAELVGDEERQFRMAQAAVERVSRYTWEGVADKTWAAIMTTSKRR